MRTENVIREAAFDPKIQAYWFVSGLIVMVVSVIGIPLIPFWVLGVGQWLVHKQYERLRCELTDRTLNIRRGYLFRVEKNIPLDKIQDLSLHEGPLLRKLGLASLKVETAGQGAAQGVAAASLVGVVDALEFRDDVLNQRDLVVGTAPAPGAARAAGAAGGEREGTLEEIRDSLLRIEKLLDERARS